MAKILWGRYLRHCGEGYQTIIALVMPRNQAEFGRSGHYRISGPLKDGFDGKVGASWGNQGFFSILFVHLE